MGQRKVLLAMTGLDPNNKRIRLLARTLKETDGVEVYYSGMYKSLEETAAEALQQQADVVGLSIYTGLHLTVFPEMRKALDDQGGQHISLFGEGLIPVQDVDTLTSSGAVARIFSPTDSIDTIVQWLRQTGS